MKALSPFISSTKPLTPQAQAKPTSSEKQARSGLLLQNGKPLRSTKHSTKKYLKKLRITFSGVLNEEGMRYLKNLVNRFKNDKNNHLDFNPTGILSVNGKTQVFRQNLLTFKPEKGFNYGLLSHLIDCPALRDLDRKLGRDPMTLQELKETNSDEQQAGYKLFPTLAIKILNGTLTNVARL